MRGIGIVNEPKKFNVIITRAKEELIVLGNLCVLATDSCWVAFMNFCSRNSLFALEDTKTATTQTFEEANVNELGPSSQEDQNHSVEATGLETALLYKARDMEAGSKAGKRFMAGAERLVDTLWRNGLEAQETISTTESCIVRGSQESSGA